MVSKATISKIKKNGVVAIIFLFISTVFAPSIASRVEQSSISNLGRDILYVGGDGPGNYTSIKDAIDNASDGNTVFVFAYSSPYFENVVVDKSINLIGEDENITIIDGNKSGDVVKITADEVTVSGFTIRNGGYSDLDIDAGGILLYPSSNSIISKNIVVENDKYGIKVEGNASSCNLISNNIVLRNGKENYRARAYFNIWLFRSCNNTISKNIIKDAKGFGIGICYWSENTTVNANIISGNKMSGIRSRYSYNNKMYLNVIENNEKFGICIMNASANNYIEQNNFVNNKPRDAYFTITNPWLRNKWNENYWSRPRIMPKPILGYLRPNINRFIGFFWFAIDWDPVLEPYNISN